MNRAFPIGLESLCTIVQIKHIRGGWLSLFSQALCVTSKSTLTQSYCYWLSWLKALLGPGQALDASNSCEISHDSFTFDHRGSSNTISIGNLLGTYVHSRN
jgi:hypothetical protein